MNENQIINLPLMIDRLGNEPEISNGNHREGLASNF